MKVADHRPGPEDTERSQAGELLQVAVANGGKDTHSQNRNNGLIGRRWRGEDQKTIVV